ncbi:hypothetical protein [Chamaesiphon sp.]|uniref:hypothetical protein n=1 Tax=Chamaesiphon sp. TaxID=2814140 RepID=UPI003593D830
MFDAGGTHNTTVREATPTRTRNVSTIAVSTAVISKAAPMPNNYGSLRIAPVWHTSTITCGTRQTLKRTVGYANELSGQIRISEWHHMMKRS